ncbi:hypothetical protein BD779DRAFT_1557203 [Infundibulicybe gibba]|nr:hypothetical protein BD779DRAFT_1557203 [Infundibulicybe gibba]
MAQPIGNAPTFKFSATPNLDQWPNQESDHADYENAPVAELFFTSDLSREEVTLMKINGDEIVSATPGQFHVLPNELRGLRGEGLDGNAWILTTTKEERREMSNSQVPISASTATTNDTGPITVRIPRATDGLFLVRAKVRAFSQWTGNFDEKQEVPAAPVLALEIKVPKSGETTLPEEVVAGSLNDNLESIRGSEFPHYIRYGYPQIVQQAQLILHGWKKLDFIWAVGASGRWVRFLKFNRRGTPEVKANNLQHGQYFTGELSEEAIEVDSTLFRFIDDDGEYTEEFRRYWDTVMRDAELQYEKCVLDMRAVDQLQEDDQ